MAYSDGTSLNYKRWDYTQTQKGDTLIIEESGASCPSLAFLPTGDIVCVYGYNGNVVYRTHNLDSDYSWETVMTIISGRTCPDMITDKTLSGKFYIACLDGSTIYFYQSDPADDPSNLTFTGIAPTIVATDADSGRSPSITFDSRGYFVVVYVDTGGDLASKESADGVTWS